MTWTKLPGHHRPGLLRERAGRPAAIVRGVEPRLERRQPRIFDPLNRLPDIAHQGKRANPPDQHHDHDGDQDKRHDEQHHLAGIVIEIGREPDNAEQAEQKRSDEGGDGVLGSLVLDPQRAGTRRRGIRGRPEGRNHGGEREDCDCQKTGRQNGQDRVDRLGFHHGFPGIRHEAVEHRRNQRDGERCDREQGRAEPDGAEPLAQ